METKAYEITEVQRSLICRLLHQTATRWERGENPHELNNHELEALDDTRSLFAPF